MGLRCWPGALCEIKWTAPHCAHLIGMRIVVTALSGDELLPAWFYESFNGRPLVSLNGLPIHVACDHCLQPIDPDTGCEWTKRERDGALDSTDLVRISAQNNLEIQHV